MTLDLETIKQGIRREKLQNSRRKALLCFLLVLVILMGVELLSLFVIGGAVAEGDSMLPAMKNGDFVLYNRLNTNPAHGEIVVLRGESDGKYDIKRTIALEGDVVDLTSDGAVAVNDTLLGEPYAQHTTTAQDLIFPQTVPPGCVFVLGDNRPGSKDSRNSTVGMISRENIEGTHLFTVRRR